MKAYVFSEWTVATSDGKVALATVFMSDSGDAYMLLSAVNDKKFYRVRKGLISKGAEYFFRNVMKTAEELPLAEAIRMGLVTG